MKANKILKIVIVMLLLIVVGVAISNTASAAWVESTLTKVDQAASNDTKSGNTVIGVMGAIINVASTIGAGVAIIMLVVIGIQYTTKGAEGKAEAKKDLTGYTIGAVILFGVSGILKLLQITMEQIISLNE